MSPRHYRTAIAPTAGPAETGTSAVPAKGIGNSADHSSRVNEQQVEPNAFDAPLGVHRQDYFSGSDKTILLPHRQRRGCVGQACAGFDFDDREKAVPLRHNVDFARRRSKPPSQDAPPVPFKCRQRGSLSGTASAVSLLPSPRTIPRDEFMRQVRSELTLDGRRFSSCRGDGSETRLIHGIEIWGETQQE
jgi:hypothetical protein